MKHVFGAAGVFSQIEGVTGIPAWETAPSQLETYFAVPLSINYGIKNFYLGTGYEYACNIGRNSMLNKNNYSIIFQVGYKLGFMDIMLKYNLGLNSEEYDTNLFAAEKSVVDLPKINNLQLSVIIPIGKQQ
ncbi:MAG: hypothetical protein ACK5MI_04345 [Mangrovibacterium sp.]